MAGHLAEKRINITHMHVGSEGKRAASFIRLAKPLSDQVVARIAKVPSIKSVVSMEFPS